MWLVIINNQQQKLCQLGNNTYRTAKPLQVEAGNLTRYINYFSQNNQIHCKQ